MKPLLFFLCLALPLAANNLDEAKQLLAAQHPVEAKPLLERVVATESENAEAWRLLGNCQRQLGDGSAALTSYEKALTVEPTHATTLFEMGTLCCELSGQRRSLPLAYKGRNLLEKAVEICPQHNGAREWLIGFYRGAPWIAGGSMKKARRHAAAMAAYAPERSFTLGIELALQDKDHEEAFAQADTWLRQKPDDLTGLYQLGLTCARSGQRATEGRRALEKCLTLAPQENPGAEKIHLQLGLLHKRTGHPAEARRQFEAGLKAKPDDKPLQDALASL